MTPLSKTATAGSESLTHIRELSNTAVDNATNPKNKRKWQRQTKLIGEVGYAVMITEAEATRIIRAHIETIIVRYEPLDRIFDPYFVASLLISHPGIGAFIPRNVSAVMKEYVLKIDKDNTSQLVLLMKN